MSIFLYANWWPVVVVIMVVSINLTVRCVFATHILTWWRLHIRLLRLLSFKNALELLEILSCRLRHFVCSLIWIWDPSNLNYSFCCAGSYRRGHLPIFTCLLLHLGQTRRCTAKVHSVLLVLLAVQHCRILVYSCHVRSAFWMAPWITYF